MGGGVEQWTILSPQVLSHKFGFLPLDEVTVMSWVAPPVVIEEHHSIDWQNRVAVPTFAAVAVEVRMDGDEAVFFGGLAIQEMAHDCSPKTARRAR